VLSARSLIRGPASTTAIQFFRYTLVGGLAFICDFGTLYLLTDWAGLHYLRSAAVAFCLGLTINYALSRIWVFDRRTLSNSALEFGLFAAIGLVGLALNEAGMWLLKEVAGLHYLVAKLGVTVLVFLWNFFARKLALFR